MLSLIANLASSSLPVSVHVTVSSAVTVVTAVWFSSTLITDVPSPALPDGPVITGDVASVISTVASSVMAVPPSVPVIVAVPAVVAEVRVAV